MYNVGNYNFSVSGNNLFIIPNSNISRHTHEFCYLIYFLKISVDFSYDALTFLTPLRLVYNLSSSHDLMLIVNIFHAKCIALALAQKRKSKVLFEAVWSFQEVLEKLKLYERLEILFVYAMCNEIIVIPIFY